MPFPDLLTFAPKENSMSKHKTGYYHTCDAFQEFAIGIFPATQTWHRTRKGAERRRAAYLGRGRIDRARDMVSSRTTT